MVLVFDPYTKDAYIVVYVLIATNVAYTPRIWESRVLSSSQKYIQ